MPQEDIRRLQLIELEMMLEVDRICRRYNISYSLAGGTLLGAVRHKGFIPWDDDLDIYMVREEYKKFIKICENELNTKKYFLQTSSSDKEYRWGYSKIRRNGTQYIRKGQEAISCHTGVSIDIFPVDNIPDSKLMRIIYHYIRRICIKTLYSVIGCVEEKKLWKKNIYLLLKNVDKKIPLKIMEKMGEISNKKKTQYKYIMSFYRVDKFAVNNKILHRAIVSEWFDNLVEIEFEGFKFLAFADNISYLKSQYKDYLAYPPQEQRFIHPPSFYDLSVEIELCGKNVQEYMELKR